MEPQEATLTEKLPEKEKPFRFYYFQHFKMKERYFVCIGVNYYKNEVPDDLHLLECAIQKPIIRVITGSEAIELISTGKMVEYQPEKKHSDAWWRMQKRAEY